MQTNYVTAQEEVKICFNKKNWASNGTYYEGCFRMKKELYNQYRESIRSYLRQKYKDQTCTTYEESQELMYLPTFRVSRNLNTKQVSVFLTITQTNFLKQFLEENHVAFDSERANRPINYYIEVI